MEVEASDSGCRTKPFGKPDKLKHRPVVLLISGEGVLSKKYLSGDAGLKKITENKELLWSVVPADGNTGEVTVSFLRKECIASLLDELAKNQIPLLGLRIVSQATPGEELTPEELLKREFSLRNLRRDKQRLNLLCELLYYRLRLPVLLFFFVLLLGNFLLSEQLRQENSVLQTELSAKQRNDRAQKELREKQGRIGGEYRKVPDVSFALLSDRIASYLPEEMRLSRLSLFPAVDTGNLIGRDKEVKLSFGIIRIVGETTIPGSVTLFSRFLGSDPLFAGVEVTALERRKDSSVYQFELHLKIKL
jgi:hypothetical protein